METIIITIIITGLIVGVVVGAIVTDFKNKEIKQLQDMAIFLGYAERTGIPIKPTTFKFEWKT